MGLGCSVESWNYDYKVLDTPLHLKQFWMSKDVNQTKFG